MKYFLIILLSWINVTHPQQDIYTCRNVRISLFSGALIEDINGVSQNGVSVYNADTGELDFSVLISTLQFEKAFMQQHFNSDYMESDKYPRATFKGKIQERIDVSKDGIYSVTVTGDLTVHGITKTRTVQGNLTVKNGVISMKSEFTVKCGDHHIDIPQILFYHIAENIKINVAATYTPYKNNTSK